VPDLQKGGGVKEKVKGGKVKMTYALLAVIVGVLLGKAKKGRR
jgi:hypothetical protein